MNFSAQQHRLSQLSARFNLMVCLVFGLLLANILLSALVWYTSVHQRIEITPFFSAEGYLKSETAIDSHYLSLMSENFIYSRLNVTPETVAANHERLLRFVDAAAYADFVKRLAQEANLIRAKKLSSVFEITALHLNPNNLSAEVSGVLKRYVGLKPLKEERRTYALSYRYHLGRLTIQRFTLADEVSHA